MGAPKLRRDWPWAEMSLRPAGSLSFDTNGLEFAPTLSLDTSGRIMPMMVSQMVVSISVPKTLSDRRVADVQAARLRY